VLGATARPGQLAIAYLRLLRRRWARTVLLTVLAERLLFFGASAYVGNATQMAPEAWGLVVSTFASCFFVGQGVGAWLAGLVIDRASPGLLFLTVAPTLLPLALALARRLARRPVS
jgi:predicted MFS family arabinose efflux permease